VFVGIAVGERVAVGVAVGGTAPPVQGTPLSEKLVGGVLLPLDVAWKAKLCEEPGLINAHGGSLVTVTAPPFCM